MSLYDRVVNKDLLIRRLNISSNHIIREEQCVKSPSQTDVQLDLFTDYSALQQVEQDKKKERRMQEALIKIKKRFGKNAILKGTSYAEGATARERNQQIGGHKA